MRHWKLLQAVIGVALVVAIQGCASPPSETSPTRRETRLGPIVGADDSASSGTYSWKGVPFARPPLGALRWRAPADPAPWHSPRAGAPIR